jgi:chromatin remodeling complex protein RSC6
MSKTTKASKSTAQPVPSETVAEVATDSSSSSVPAKQRVAPTPESVLSRFDSLRTRLQDVVQHPSPDSVNLKLVREVLREMTQLRSQTEKVMKRKRTTVRKSTTQTGFMKPVFISQELAKFIGVDAKKEYPRKEVTHLLHEYMKTHNLQDEKDGRRFHIEKDAKLASLLSYDGEPGSFTYPLIQRYIKRHYTTTVDGTVAKPAPAEKAPAKKTQASR